MENDSEIVLEEKTSRIKQFLDGHPIEVERVTRLSVSKKVLQDLLKNATDKIARLQELGYKPEHIEKIKQKAPELFEG